MCKTEECSTVIAYKDLENCLHLSSLACETANGFIRKRRLKEKVENIFISNLPSFPNQDYYEGQEAKRFARLLENNWKKVRDQLNSIKEE